MITVEDKKISANILGNKIFSGSIRHFAYVETYPVILFLRDDEKNEYKIIKPTFTHRYRRRILPRKNRILYSKY